jgi:uncharacterized protein YegP (UPF0339 family)
MNTTSDFRVYENAEGEWRWKLVAGNNRVIARSEGSWTTKPAAVRAVFDILSDVRADRVGIETESLNA